MKKKLCILLLTLVLLGGMLFWAYDYATDFLVKKTLVMVSNDPQIKADVDNAINAALASNEEKEPSQEDEPQDSSDKTPDKSSENLDKPSVPATNDGSLTIDDLENSDKAYVMSIYKRFSTSEVSQVSNMLSGGITPEEKKMIKSIVYSKVSQAEVNRLFAIAKKYRSN